MARKLKANGEGQDATTVQHNSKARKEIISSVCSELHALESEKASINEQIAELKNKRIKGDLGMKVSDFNFAYRAYKLEGKDRALLLDTMRETFEALGIGEQLDFITASQRKPGDAGASDQPAAKH